MEGDAAANHKLAYSLVVVVLFFLIRKNHRFVAKVSGTVRSVGDSQVRRRQEMDGWVRPTSQRGTGDSESQSERDR